MKEQRRNKPNQMTLNLKMFFLHLSVGAPVFFFSLFPPRVNHVVNSFKTSLFDVMDQLDVIHFGDATTLALLLVVR